MTIYDNHPPFKDFIENEVKTLEQITNWGLFKDYSDLLESVTQTYLSYTGKVSKGTLNIFDFHSKFVMEIEGRLQEVIIGANITNDFDECSYVLAVLDENDPRRLIRKFHFDYALATHKTNQKVPSYHLQYGGKMSPKMQADELDDSHLSHWLSLPRINFYPINLALVFDLMFCEFRTAETTKITEDTHWRSLIWENEKFLSCSYYTNVANHIGSATYGKNKLLRDFCYGEQF